MSNTQYDLWSDDELNAPALHRRQTHRIEQIWKHFEHWSKGDTDRHEPVDWVPFNVLCRAGTTMDTLVGENHKRREVAVYNTCSYVIYVSNNRSTGFGNTGAQINPGGALVLRTRGAIFGCCPAAAALSPPQDQEVTIIQAVYK